jgi:hypothetical protein
LQAYLMRQVAIGPGQEEVSVKLHSALWLGVDLNHPALHPIGIELVIDCTVERISEVDAASIATDFDHLRPTVKRPMALRMRGACDDAPKAQLPVVSA